MRRPLRLAAGLLTALALTACPTEGDPLDGDKDGWPTPEDCDDDNVRVHPEAGDPYGDGLDQDCDGSDGVDLDGDGYPSNVPLHPEHGHLQDCDDGDAAIHPGQPDTVGDDVDQDCDGADGVDADGDGYATPESGGDDCDDADEWAHPGANDYVGDGGDQNCDGVDGVDDDGDGHASEETLGGDCDDGDASVHPGATEACDGIDSDCLPDFDELDEDGDGWMVCAGDCDDGEPTTHPEAVEECNDVDQNCDGVLPNADGDGDGYAACAGDCDDADDQVHPAAAEVCNGLDDNCNGVVPPDEADGDGDGWTGCGGDCDDADGDAFPGQWFESVDDGVDSDCDGQDTAVRLSGASVVFEGSSGRNIFGGAVAAAGDVDGDGLADVLVAAPGSNSTGSGAYTAGRTLVFTGAQLLVPGPDPLTRADAWAVLEGEGGLDFSGTSMAGAGDVDGDGLDDIVIGAFGNDDAASNAGKAYLVRGSDLAGGGTFDLANAAWRWTGESGGDELGISVAGAGDVDGDGRGDVLLGAHQAGGYRGRVYLVQSSALGAPGEASAGSIGRVLVGEASGDFAGTSVAGGGNVDDDGLADLLIGAPSADGGGFGSGRAYVVPGNALSGSGTFQLSGAQVIVDGDWNNQQSGEVVRFVDDLDGDGLSELGVGWVTTDIGFRVLLSGGLPASGTVDLGDSDHLFPGRIPGPSGTSSDVDGDGLADLLVGYPDLGVAGGARLFLGANLSAGTHGQGSADFAWNGVSTDDDAGHMVAGVGDVDGDGLDDLLVGGHRPGTSSTPGEAYLLLSPY